MTHQIPLFLTIFDIYSPRDFQNTKIFEVRSSITRVRDRNSRGVGEKVTHFLKIFGMEPALHKDLLPNRDLNDLIPRGQLIPRFGSKSLCNAGSMTNFSKSEPLFRKFANVLVSNSSSTGPIFKILDVLESPRAVDTESGQKSGQRIIISMQTLRIKNLNRFLRISG